MTSKIKSAIAIAAIGSATLGLYSIGAMAASDNHHSATMKLQQLQVKMMRLHRAKPRKVTVIRAKRVVVYNQKRRNPWRLGLYRNKNLTPNNARTITKAALLMRNRHDLGVGQIKTRVNRRGHKQYLIQIINNKQQLVKTVVMNSATGHIRPLRVRPAQKLIKPVPNRAS